MSIAVQSMLSRPSTEYEGAEMLERAFREGEMN